MKFLFLLLTLHVVSGQIQQYQEGISFNILKSYLNYEFSSNPDLVVSADNDPRQTQFYATISSPTRTDDFIQVTTPFYEQGSLVRDKYLVEVFKMYDRPYRHRVSSSKLPDIKVVVDSVLLGPLGIPKDVEFSASWKESIAEADIPALLKF